MTNAAAILPLREAAIARGLSVSALRRLSAAHGGSFLAKRGGRGRGRSAQVDMAALDRILAPQNSPDAATEAARRKAAVLDRLRGVLADRFEGMFRTGELTALVPNLKPREAAQICAYSWAAAVLALDNELLTAGIEPPPLEMPHKIAAIRQF